jgi:hypothetical protein
MILITSIDIATLKLKDNATPKIGPFNGNYIKHIKY